MTSKTLFRITKQGVTDPVQHRYVGDIGDYVKLAILRGLSPGYRLGVAWWLYPDEDHNKDGRHIDYLSHPSEWRQFDPNLFDILQRIVASGQRDVRVLENAGILLNAIYASDPLPGDGAIAHRQGKRRQWFETVLQTLAEANLVFVDPDNGLEPDGYRHGSGKAGKSVLLDELRELAKPDRCLIVYHHHTRRKGGHHAEVDYWSDRLRQHGFKSVDALRAKPFSPRVFFLLDAPNDVRQRAEVIEDRWNGWISWHPDVQIGTACSTLARIWNGTAHTPMKKRIRRAETTSVGYINRNRQEVVRPTGLRGTDHGQYVYVLRCQSCGHKYGANGSDIWLRRCPAHDKGAPGLPH